MKTSGYILVTFKFYKEGKKWVALCEELGTSTFGSNLIEAKDRLIEAVLCHLNTLEDVGERERFFRKNRIKFSIQKPQRKEIEILAPLSDDIFVQPHLQRVPVHA
jgi:predicted RNase H-like HicB family nuclease